MLPRSVYVMKCHVDTWMPFEGDEKEVLWTPVSRNINQLDANNDRIKKCCSHDMWTI